MKYKFTQCGCELDLDNDGIPIVDYDKVLDEFIDCPATWALIGTGNTKSLFQLESPLGQSNAKKLKPENIEQLAALVSILRPGCLESYRDGKNVTQHYIDRKNGVEDVTYYHPALEPALKKTYGEMIYQEQAMQIAKDIAGFTLQEADELRKAIGKKLPELMAKVKIKFLEGCKKQKIVTDEEAIVIFDAIEKSQRYSFNKCVSPDTIVETHNGFTTLEDIQINDNIKTINNKYTKILNKYNNGIQSIYEITLISGKTIKCTLEHEFLCEDMVKRPLYEILCKNYKIICQND